MIRVGFLGVHDSLETQQSDDHPFNVILRMNDFNEVCGVTHTLACRTLSMYSGKSFVLNHMIYFTRACASQILLSLSQFGSRDVSKVIGTVAT